MLYEMTRELATELKAKKVPYPVVYGPEANVASTTRTRIVVERDRELGDEITPQRAHPRVVKPGSEARMVGQRGIGAIVRIYAQSTTTGARVQDHERVADHLVDKVQAALRAIVSRRRTVWRTRSAGMLSAAELERTEIRTWPGVVYELRLLVDRGVFDTEWGGPGLPGDPDGGAGTPTGEITAVTTTDEIYTEAAPEGTPPATAC